MTTYKKFIALYVLLVMVAMPGLVLAVVCNSNDQCSANPAEPLCSNGVCVSASQWFKNIIVRLLNFVVWPVFIALAIIMFIWAGILFLTAHGEPEKISQARKAVIWAVVGIVVGLLGFTIVSVLRGALGL